MADLYLVQGPAGGGKTAVVRDMISAGEASVVVDITALWVALAGVVRGLDGRFPLRLDSDPALHVARQLRVIAVEAALARGASVAVTSSSPEVERWERVAARGPDSRLFVRTVDPGETVVSARLADPATGQLSGDCAKAIARWYTRRGLRL